MTQTGEHTSRSLPPELIAEGARRLGWLGLIYAAGVAVGRYGHRAALWYGGSIEAEWRLPDWITAGCVAMGLAVYVIARNNWLPPKRLLDAGLAFQVGGALGIAASGILDTGMPIPYGSTWLVPAECVWIVVYPLVVPNTPGKVLITSSLAATMAPLALALGQASGTPPLDSRFEWWLTPPIISNYISALVAYAIARVVHRTGMRLKQLRDIGSYELVGRIGEGGMGEVWRATHRLLARPAAIKLIRRDVLGSNSRAREPILQRFEREARDTAALGSIHTVDVYDFGVTEEGDFYYVMELLDGLSLEHFVKTFGPMAPARVVYLLRQVTHSLGEAHGRGLLHRDIKPANIFLCRLGPDDDFVKVLDFGLVKHFQGSAESLLTRDGATAGTPAYMAPEIALGRPDVDGRADIYSMGCVAYYLLTGHLVFAGETAVAMALAHVSDTPVPPSQRSEFEIPPALETVILDCLAKDPARRPASVLELDRRLADAAPRDAWTADAAQAWWRLHHRDTLGRVVKDEGSPDEAQRCRPRLDRAQSTQPGNSVRARATSVTLPS